MSVMFGEVDSDIEFAERRQEVRVVVRIPGRFSLASKRDTKGDRRRFACRAINMSHANVMLATPISGPIGERVIAYFEEFGKSKVPSPACLMAVS